jgi:hypothetical protein
MLPLGTVIPNKPARSKKKTTQFNNEFKLLFEEYKIDIKENDIALGAIIVLLAAILPALFLQVNVTIGGITLLFSCIVALFLFHNHRNKLKKKYRGNITKLSKKKHSR